jgi:hypothetical protein
MVAISHPPDLIELSKEGLGTKKTTQLAQGISLCGSLEISPGYDGGLIVGNTERGGMFEKLRYKERIADLRTLVNSQFKKN